VYGSLLVPEVLLALLERVPRAEEASLPGWSVRCLRGVSYPGLVADDTATASGLLLHDLTVDEVALIDAWESDFYRKQFVQPVDAGGAIVEAEAYVVDDHHVLESVDRRDWTVDVLKPELEEFCEQTRRFRRAWPIRSEQD
jgi:hypothetical protein